MLDLKTSLLFYGEHLAVQKWKLSPNLNGYFVRDDRNDAGVHSSIHFLDLWDFVFAGNAFFRDGGGGPDEQISMPGRPRHLRLRRLTQE